MVTEAAVEAVEQPSRRHRWTIAVRRSVGEQSGAPVVLVLCDRDAFACTGCSKGGGRQRLKIVINVRSSDSRRFLIDFIEFTFLKEA